MESNRVAVGSYTTSFTKGVGQGTLDESESTEMISSVKQLHSSNSVACRLRVGKVSKGARHQTTQLKKGIETC